MKKVNIPALTVAVIALIIAAGCSGSKPGSKPAAQEAPVSETSKPVIIGNETTLLLKDLKENGDFVNSKAYPALIKASIVHDELAKNILVIDLRSQGLYSEGHIKGAVSKSFEKLPEYFETGIKPFTYEKIIMVCEDGQLSSYATCLLRLMGYGNVYAMRWGMSAWNKTYAAGSWLRGVSGKYESQLDTVSHEKPDPECMPELGTGKATGQEIGAARFKKLFSEGTSGLLITAEQVFSDPGKYYVINLERKDKYEDGHIPGAIRYKPEATLGITGEMATIPPGKSVVIYCGTGHNSAFATAYLRLLGYDAHTLKYGNNSFMYDKMGKERVSLSWLPFSEADVNNFETVK